jgi:hypothetical protein
VGGTLSNAKTWSVKLCFWDCVKLLVRSYAKQVNYEKREREKNHKSRDLVPLYPRQPSSTVNENLFLRCEPWFSPRLFHTVLGHFALSLSHSVFSTLSPSKEILSQLGKFLPLFLTLYPPATISTHKFPLSPSASRTEKRTAGKLSLRACMWTPTSVLSPIPEYLTRVVPKECPH